VVAIRDAAVHAAAVLRVERDAVAGVFARTSAADRPPDLRGASVGMTWVLAATDGNGTGDAVVEAVRGAARPDTFGDFLAGLFAVAREQVLGGGGTLDVLDDVLDGLSESDFLVALPALRLAFSWFPPREREAIAGRLLTRRGQDGSARALLRLTADPEQLARARAVEARVDELLAREALVAGG
jgi:hypothetical protein